LREFLWSEEMADASVYVMENVDHQNQHINIGTGKELTIKQLAELIAKTVGYDGKFVFNADKPDGTMRKLTDVSKLHDLGWQHQIDIRQGVEKLYQWYLKR
jgi:GDP-L-fucose synthase